MTAPIVVHYNREPLNLRYLEDSFEVYPKASGDIATVRRDRTDAPKGQLWERLAEVRLEDVVRSPLFTARLQGAVVRALDRAFVRRVAPCTCFVVENPWTYHGIVEPGGAMEFNPECPVHA